MSWKALILLLLLLLLLLDASQPLATSLTAHASPPCFLELQTKVPILSIVQPVFNHYPIILHCNLVQLTYLWVQFSPPATDGICSDYLDAFSSTFDRYIFVINLFARNGFYVVLDNQLNSDPTIILEGKEAWLGYWREIATAVAADEYAVNKVIIDGLNVGSKSFLIFWHALCALHSTVNLADWCVCYWQAVLHYHRLLTLHDILLLHWGCTTGNALQICTLALIPIKMHKGI